ncbi:MAG: secondary thiamine-phosphate synthase enzyme YjbQ [Proteobacteria bacterium]|nr:secondary thiamine-phosphate synthase enzyme YjbQ [Pseudomonadota bacterium]
MILQVPTSQKTQLVDITRQVADAVARKGFTDGAVVVFAPHTTAAVTINEAADPAVPGDILLAINRMVEDDLPYRHGEGNSPAHVKSSLVGASEIVAVENGRLALGTWQGIFFCEFDGPRQRKVRLFFLPGT